MPRNPSPQQDTGIHRQNNHIRNQSLLLCVPKFSGVLTLILSARLLKDTIMFPGLLIFFRTRTVWAKSVGE